MAHCFLAVKAKLECKLGYFDLIGCDFLIDENFKVLLRLSGTGGRGGAPRGPEKREKRRGKWRGTRREAKSRPARYPSPPALSPCLFSLSCRSNSSKSDILRRQRRALCSCRFALPRARSGRFGYFRR